MALISVGPIHLLKLSLFKITAKAAAVFVEVAPPLARVRRPLGEWRQRQPEAEDPLAPFFVFGPVRHLTQHPIERGINWINDIVGLHMHNVRD